MARLDDPNCIWKRNTVEKYSQEIKLRNRVEKYTWEIHDQTQRNTAGWRGRRRAGYKEICIIQCNVPYFLHWKCQLRETEFNSNWFKTRYYSWHNFPLIHQCWQLAGLLDTKVTQKSFNVSLLPMSIFQQICANFDLSNFSFGANAFVENLRCARIQNKFWTHLNLLE